MIRQLLRRAAARATRHRVAELELELLSLQDEVDATVVDASTARRLLRKVAAERDALRAELEALPDSLDALEASLAELRRDKEVVDLALFGARGSMKRLRARLDDCEANLGLSSNHRQELVAERNGLQVSLATTRAELGAAQRRVEGLDVALEVAANELERCKEVDNELQEARDLLEEGKRVADAAHARARALELARVDLTQQLAEYKLADNRCGFTRCGLRSCLDCYPQHAELLKPRRCTWSDCEVAQGSPLPCTLPGCGYPEPLQPAEVPHE